ncbi:MAG: AAA family ATPase [Pseudomonadota bacterium]|nr:AAA family ATPase [Pseudomonadota bacterium]
MTSQVQVLMTKLYNDIFTEASSILDANPSILKAFENNQKVLITNIKKQYPKNSDIGKKLLLVQFGSELLTMVVCAAATEPVPSDTKIATLTTMMLANNGKIDSKQLRENLQKIHEYISQEPDIAYHYLQNTIRILVEGCDRDKGSLILDKIRLLVELTGQIDNPKKRILQFNHPSPMFPVFIDYLDQLQMPEYDITDIARYFVPEYLGKNRMIIQDPDPNAPKNAAFGPGTSMTTHQDPSLDDEEQIQGIEKDDTLEKALADLELLIGLAPIKKEIERQANRQDVNADRRKRKLPIPGQSLHMCFMGNPGTGKTEIARLLGRVYKHRGILPKGHVVEVSAKDLIAGYVGQTALKAGKVIEEAMGGILIVDEAYSVVMENGGGNSDIFGKECISTLIKAMEDSRGEFMVIFTGYKKPMEHLLNINEGMRSRIGTYFNFPDYNQKELEDIFDVMCAKNALTYGAGVKEKVIEHSDYERKVNEEKFGNARTVRTLLENDLLGFQADRIAALKAKLKDGETISDEVLQHLTKEDADKLGKPKDSARFSKHLPNSKPVGFQMPPHINDKPANSNAKKNKNPNLGLNMG